MPYGSLTGPVGYTNEGNFASEATQIGLYDAGKTVNFGAGGLTDNGFAAVGADGVIEVLKDAYFSIKQRFRASRVGQPGISEMFFWAEVSADGGTTWNLIGNSVTIKLNTSDETSVFFDLANLKVPIGTKFRNRFARSSTGHDSGDLLPSTPSAALTAAGVPIAPSAQVTIYIL